MFSMQKERRLPHVPIQKVATALPLAERRLIRYNIASCRKKAISRAYSICSYSIAPGRKKAYSKEGIALPLTTRRLPHVPIQNVAIALPLTERGLIRKQAMPRTTGLKASLSKSTMQNQSMQANRRAKYEPKPDVRAVFEGNASPYAA